MEINTGDQTLSIHFLRKDPTFTSTVFLSYTVESLISTSWVKTSDNNAAGVRLSHTSVNAPYTDSPVITFSPKSFTDTGLYRIRIKAENGPSSSQCTVYFRIIPNNQLPKFYEITDLQSPLKLTVTYDTLINNGINKKWECNLGTGKTRRKIFYVVGYLGFSLSIDKQHTFWSAQGESIVKFGKVYTTVYNEKNSVYKTDPSISTYQYYFFSHLTDGTTFIGNHYGIFRAKDGVLSYFPENDSIRSHQFTYSMCEYNDTIWVSSKSNTNNAGKSLFSVVKYYGNSSVELPSTSLKNTTELFTYPLSKLKHDKKGTLWAIANINSGSDKIIKFDGTNWISVHGLDLIDVPSYGYPVEYTFDTHGKMWILTNKKNIIEFDGVNVGRIIESKNTLLSKLNDNLPDIAIDSLNTIYLPCPTSMLLFNPDGIPLPSIAVTAVEESEAENVNTGVYPQPARDNITFDLPAESRDNPTTIEIFSSQGMALMQGTTLSDQSRYTMATNELASGLYFAVIHAGKSIVKKPFMVVR
ncbi:MAG: T9SS type A sorting domain-containing protein [Candidatus Kapaibacterium sp.]